MANVDYLDKGISPMQPTINAAHTGDKNGDNVGVRLCEEKCLGYINIRLAADNSQGAEAVKKVLGVALPSINQRTTAGAVSVLGFGPSEWLVITESGAESELVKQLEQALSGVFSLVCDVSGGTTMLNITGQHAQDLLEKGTYVDLHDSVFAVDSLYATQIAHAPAVIVKNADNDFTLIVRRSFSHHIANWAVDGAAEYGFDFS